MSNAPHHRPPQRPPHRPHHSLGRRLLPAVAMTAAAAGLIGVLDRPSSGSAGTLLGGGGVGQGSPSAGGPPTSATSAPVATLPPANPFPAGGDDPNNEDGGGGVNPAPTPTAAPTTQPAAQPASTGPCQGKTVDGPTVNTRWGPVKVEAVVASGGRICDVSAIRYPNSHGRSVRINQQALPILHDEVMKAQSARIYGVSGATITSEAYVESLQAILDGSAG
jgi:uncharacterized protein with FMN-binding domain